MIIGFDIGDFSGDGHEKSVEVIAECSHTANEIAAAYHAACKKTGFEFHEQVCSSYEERDISPQNLARLRELGYTPSEDFDPEWVTFDDIFDMFVVMVHQGDPAILITRIEYESFFHCGRNGDEPPRNFQMGYGVFA